MAVRPTLGSVLGSLVFAAGQMERRRLEIERDQQRWNEHRQAILQTNPGAAAAMPMTGAGLGVPGVAPAFGAPVVGGFGAPAAAAAPGGFGAAFGAKPAAGTRAFPAASHSTCSCGMSAVPLTCRLCVAYIQLRVGSVGSVRRLERLLHPRSVGLGRRRHRRRRQVGLVASGPRQARAVSRLQNLESVS